MSHHCSPDYRQCAGHADGRQCLFCFTKTVEVMSELFTKKGLFRLMKFSFLQLLVIGIAAGVSYGHKAWAQELLQERISISARNANLKSVLQNIEKQANVVFSYQKQVLP